MQPRRDPPPPLDGLRARPPAAQRSSTPPRGTAPPALPTQAVRGPPPSLDGLRQNEEYAGGGADPPPPPLHYEEADPPPPPQPQPQSQGLSTTPPPLPATNMRQLPYTVSAAATAGANADDITLRVTPILDWADKLGWQTLDEEQETLSRMRLRELVGQTATAQARTDAQLKELEEENKHLLQKIQANGLSNYQLMRYENQAMADAGAKVDQNKTLCVSLKQQLAATIEANKTESQELRINLSVDIDASPTDTVKMLKTQLQKEFSGEPYKEDTMPDMVELWLEYSSGGRREKLR